MFKYYYGVMASGKSLSLLVSAFQEEKNGNEFLTKEQVIQLWRLSKIGMEVLCFGLKTNFKNELFDSISTLMVYADKIKAIQPSCSCKHCGDIATTHLLIVIRFSGKV